MLFYSVEGFLGLLKTSNLVQTGAFLGTTYTGDPKCRLPPITAFLHPGRSIKFEAASLGAVAFICEIEVLNSDL